MHPDDRFFGDCKLWLSLLAAALALPWIPMGAMAAYVLQIATLTLLYMILAQGLNLGLSATGLFDLGYVAFFALGAYTTGILMVDWHWNFWLVIPVVLLQGALWGGLRAGLFFRLEGYGFAACTFAFAALVMLVIGKESALTGGMMGLSGISRPELFGQVFTQPRECYYLVLALLLVVLWVLVRVRKSRLGRAWYALRVDPVAAACMGIDTTRYKFAASVLSAMIGALAGAFYATWFRFLHPDMFTFRESILVLGLVAFGGYGSISGALLGALLLIPLSEILYFILPAGLGPARFLLLGLLVVLTLRWRPAGLLPAWGREGERHD